VAGPVVEGQDVVHGPSVTRPGRLRKGKVSANGIHRSPSFQPGLATAAIRWKGHLAHPGGRAHMAFGGVAFRWVPVLPPSGDPTPVRAPRSFLPLRLGGQPDHLPVCQPSGLLKAFRQPLPVRHGIIPTDIDQRVIGQTLGHPSSCQCASPGRPASFTNTSYSALVTGYFAILSSRGLFADSSLTTDGFCRCCWRETRNYHCRCDRPLSRSGRCDHSGGGT
jgi:hypothetical protein